MTSAFLPTGYDKVAPTTCVLDHLALRGAPESPALLIGDRTINYAEFDRLVGQLAAILSQRATKRGSRVASWLDKGLLACLLPLATARAGMVHVPLNPLYKRVQVAHILNDCEAALLLGTDARLAQLMEGDVPDDCEIWTHDSMIADMEKAHPLPASSGDPDALAALMYTSGSTGSPKGVMLTHANLWLGAHSVASYLGLRPEDRTLAVLPLAFDYGQNQLLSSWFAGSAVAPLNYLLPRDVVTAVDRHSITTLAGVPALWTQLSTLNWPEATAAKLRRLTNSGGALYSKISARLTELFPNADLYLMYGLTEAFRSTYLEPSLVARHPDSIGQNVPFAEIMVVGTDGKETAADETGELVHAGPLVAQGYWRDPARTAERFRPAPDWSSYGGTAVWSGDSVRRDEGGLLYFVGRRDAMIKSQGYRISPTEIEEAALQTGEAHDAVAFGVADGTGEQEVWLAVRGDGSDEELRRKLASILPTFMQPARIFRCMDFPLNPNGKIDRSGLKAQLITESGVAR